MKNLRIQPPGFFLAFFKLIAVIWQSVHTSPSSTQNRIDKIRILQQSADANIQIGGSCSTPPNQNSSFYSGVYPNCSLNTQTSSVHFENCCFLSSQIILTNGSKPDGTFDPNYVYSKKYPDCAFSKTNNGFDLNCNFSIYQSLVLQNGLYYNGSTPMVCNAGQYSTGQTCLPCDGLCYTCIGPLSTQCLTCRANTVSLGLRSGKCICYQGYSMDQKGTCLKNCSSLPTQSSPYFSGIYPNCSLISGSFPSCCFPDPTIVLPTLLYPNGTAATASYTFSGSYPDCRLIDGAYQNCNFPNTFANSILQNGTYINGSSPSGPIPCLQGTYGDPGACMPCDTSCLTCSGGDNTSCTSCRPNSKPLATSVGTCMCNSGFYWDPTYTCFACHPSCVNCSGPGNKDCLACSVPFNLQNDSSCSCNYGYFYNGAACQPCSPTCGSCTGSALSQCTSCKGNNVFLKPTGECACLPGYTTDSTGICNLVGNCDITCLTCFASNQSDACVSCKYPAILTSANVCACPINFFPDLTKGGCSQCDQRCQVCTSNSTSTRCQKCKSGYILELVNYTCICPISQFEINTSGQFSCSPCLNKSCRTCTSVPNLNTCLSCKENMILSSSDQCTCINGYAINNATGECQRVQCYDLCLGCTGPNSIDCTDCVENANKNSSNLCACNQGFFNKNNTCTPCHGTCNKCIDEKSTSCTYCKNNANLQTVNGSKACVCSKGFFMDSSTGNCIKCHSSCSECTNNTMQCLACVGNTVKDPISLMCSCNKGFYLESSNGQCIACDLRCDSCYGGSNSNCSSCKSPSFLDPVSSTCTCKLGEYINLGGTCNKCHPTCRSCVNDGPSFCTDCDSTANLSRHGSWPYGECICNSTLIPRVHQTVEGRCYKCHYTCQTCSPSDGSITGCLSCISETSSNRTATSLCKYASGVTNDSTIIQCHPTCDTCANSKPTGCLSCPTNMIPNVNTGECYCPLFQFFSSNLACESCNSTCRTCWQGTNAACITCKDHALLIGGFCVCVDGYYQDSKSGECMPCNDTCVQCLGPKVNDCSACDPIGLRKGDGTCGCLGQMKLSNDLSIAPKSQCLSATECGSDYVRICTVGVVGECVPGATSGFSSCSCGKYIRDSGHCGDCSLSLQ